MLGLLLALVSAAPFISPEIPVTGAVPGPWGGLYANNWETPPLAMDFDGTNHVVFWMDGRAPALMAARVSAEGAVLDPAGVVLRVGVDPQLYPGGHVAAAFGAGQHLVVFSILTMRGGYLDGDLVAVRFDRDLQPIDQTPIAISRQPLPLSPTAAFDGTQFIVGWSAGTMPSTMGANSSRYAARVATNGQLLDPNNILVATIGNGSYNAGRYTVACAGGISLFVIQTVDIDAMMVPHFRALARRMRGDGTWVDASPIVLGGDSRYETLPGVGSNGSELLVSWNEGHPGRDRQRPSVRRRGREPGRRRVARVLARVGAG